MKCVVTGGAGFIGSNLVDRLVSDGHQVSVIDNESAAENEKFYWREDTFFNSVNNVTDYDAIQHCFKDIDYVFHLAATSRIQPAIKNPKRTYKNNCLSLMNVLQLARENNIKKVIFSSSSSIYGLNTEVPLKETLESDCLNPYSVSKLAGEDLCKMYYRMFGVESVCLRYFNVYGPKEPTKGQYAPVVGLFLRQHQAQEPMTIVGDGEQRRDFTHVDDVVEANLLAAGSYTGEAEVINIGTGTNYSMNDLAKLINPDTSMHAYISEREGEARETLADISKARKLLNYNPTKDLRDYINTNK